MSSGILMAIGDGLSQHLERKKPAKGDDIQKPFDWSRNAKMFLVGASQGPLHHYFYSWLDRKYVGATLRVTSIKILYDQVVMSPLCIVLFFFSAGWMYKQSNAEIAEELKSKFLTVYITDWLVWPFAQFLNFHYLDQRYRVIYVNGVTMFYNVFLSYVKHSSTDSKLYRLH